LEFIHYLISLNKMKNKKGTNMQEIITHLILILLITTLFILNLSSKIDSRNVKQQILEKQTALLIDSAIPGMSFIIQKNNVNGYINKIEIKENKIFVQIDGLVSVNGYPILTQHNVQLIEDSNQNKYIIQIT